MGRKRGNRGKNKTPPGDGDSPPRDDAALAAATPEATTPPAAAEPTVPVEAAAAPAVAAEADPATADAAPEPAAAAPAGELSDAQVGALMDAHAAGVQAMQTAQAGAERARAAATVTSERIAAGVAEGLSPEQAKALWTAHEEGCRAIHAAQDAAYRAAEAARDAAVQLSAALPQGLTQEQAQQLYALHEAGAAAIIDTQAAAHEALQTAMQSAAQLSQYVPQGLSDEQARELFSLHERGAESILAAHAAAHDGLRSAMQAAAQVAAAMPKGIPTAQAEELYALHEKASITALEAAQGSMEVLRNGWRAAWMARENIQRLLDAEFAARGVFMDNYEVASNAVAEKLQVLARVINQLRSASASVDFGLQVARLMKEEAEARARLIKDSAGELKDEFVALAKLASVDAFNQVVKKVATPENLMLLEENVRLALETAEMIAFKLIVLGLKAAEKAQEMAAKATKWISRYVTGTLPDPTTLEECEAYEDERRMTIDLQAMKGLDEMVALRDPPDFEYREMLFAEVEGFIGHVLQRVITAFVDTMADPARIREIWWLLWTEEAPRAKQIFFRVVENVTLHGPPEQLQPHIDYVRQRAIEMPAKLGLEPAALGLQPAHIELGKELAKNGIEFARNEIHNAAKEDKCVFPVQCVVA